ncbi:MAG TPA: hypothetical protein VMU05_09065, partial [Dongiaceae bacterium]|nr:hypothetical protein [Dongiaceae bacterium]
MRYSTAACGGGIGHNGYAGGLEEVREVVLRHVAVKFDLRIARILSSDRLYVASGLRMIATCYHQPGIRHFGRQALKSFNHQFEPLVGPPFSEGQNSMNRSSATGEVRELGAAGQQA